MDNIEISEIFNNLKNYTKLFIFKVPTNYDFNFFIKNTNTNTSNYSIFEYKNKNRIVFYYIFISI